MSLLLLQGSASRLPLRDESVQCVVTSPPYWGLRQYAGEQVLPEWGCALGLEPTPELYVEHMVAVFREVRRVLRAGGTLWLNLGDSYAGASSGNNNGTGATTLGSAKGTGSMLAARRLGEQVSAANAGLRKPLAAGLKAKDLVGIPWLVAFALRADGWYLRSDIIWHKPNPMPESVTDRPTKAHEYLFLLTKSERYFYDADAIKDAAVSDHPSGNGYKREARLSYLDGDGPRGNDEQWQVQATRNKRTVWTIPTRPYPGAHFATFPEQLVEPCILAGSARGDLPLDPFNGSGTTGRVAIKHGRSYVGVDISREYLVEQSKARINNIQHTLGMEAAS